jgi:hypothetical protein
MVMVIFSFNSAQAQIIIVGQNNPTVDIRAIQKALDQGGPINLKGTFDFGDKGRVNITKDVMIVGETDNRGNPITKIKGGFWAFHSPLPAKLPPEVPGPKITIQGIYFDGALWAPIYLAYSSGATIRGNKITNVRPILSEEPIFGKTGLNRQQGIACSPVYVQPLATRKYQPGAFTGLLTIVDNEIDMINEDPTKTMAQGVFVLWTTGITARISRNIVNNCSRNSIELIDNYLGKDGSGMVVIEDNKIVTAPTGLPVPTPFTPIGILGGWFLDMTGAVDPMRNIKYTIINNAVRVRGEASIGICPFADGAVVASNGILAEGGAFVLAIANSNGYVAHNKIEGVGRHAMSIRPFGPLKASKNVFVGNDLRQFKASLCDVALEKDSKDNVVCGSSGTVVDQGSGNQIEGLKSIAK